MRTLPLTKAAALLAASSAMAAGLMTASATSASAVVVSRDWPLLSAGPRDFGTNFIGGAPQTGGTLRWDLVGGVMFPRLTGNLYLANGVCGRINVVYHDAAANTLGQASSAQQCGPAAGVAGFPVALNTFGDPNVDHVHVNLQRPTAGGGWVTVASALESP
jgi:hypothetical protein